MTTPPRLVAALVALVFVAGACTSSASTTATPAPTAEAPVESDATESEPAEAPASGASELEATVLDLIGDRPGGAVVLHRHQGEVTSIVVGQADAEGRPLTADDRLRVGSISKPFVATMVLQLVAEGAVDLDTPLSTYVDTPVGGEVTVRQLLSHRSGVPSYTDNVELITRTMMDRTSTIDADDIFEAVGEMNGRDPGGPFQYSNTNYLLAGLLIEAVDGTDLSTSLKQRITDPLGLSDTAFELAELPADGVGGWSTGLLSGDPTEDYRSIASGAWAAGALVSTAPELLRFLDALVNDELLPKDLSQEMTTTGTGYGLGLTIRSQGASTIIGHGGAIPGFLSTMEIATDTGDAVIVLVNNDRLPIDRIARAVERSR